MVAANTSLTSDSSCCVCRPAAEVFKLFPSWIFNLARRKFIVYLEIIQHGNNHYFCIHVACSLYQAEAQAEESGAELFLLSLQDSELYPAASASSVS